VSGGSSVGCFWTRSRVVFLLEAPIAHAVGKTGAVCRGLGIRGTRLLRVISGAEEVRRTVEAHVGQLILGAEARALVLGSRAGGRKTVLRAFLLQSLSRTKKPGGAQGTRERSDADAGVSEKPDIADTVFHAFARDRRIGVRRTCAALEQVGNFRFVRRRCTVNTRASVGLEEKPRLAHAIGSVATCGARGAEVRSKVRTGGAPLVWSITGFEIVHLAGGAASVKRALEARQTLAVCLGSRSGDVCSVRCQC